jgi:hypothetical protein
MPWIAVQLLQRVWGGPTVPALAVAAIFPATSILLSWAEHRRAEYIGIGVLVTILSGIAVALLTNDVRFAVLKGAPAFALFGLACLLSLRRELPLVSFVGRQFTAGDEARTQAWTARLKMPDFVDRCSSRRSFRAWLPWSRRRSGSPQPSCCRPAWRSSWRSSSNRCSALAP